MKFLTAFVSGVLMMTGNASAGVERIGEPTFNGQRLPFSTAVRAGDTVYLSGSLGIDASGAMPLPSQ